MKQTKELDRIQDQMKPGVITHDGFLGDDTRNLRDIIEHDNEAVKRLGLTHQRIAGRLDSLRDAVKSGLGTAITLEKHLEVRVNSFRGKLPCPFQHPGIYQKTHTIVRNLETGGEIIFTDLSTHLIAAHGFYGGRGSPYRLEPEKLVKELNIR